MSSSGARGQQQQQQGCPLALLQPRGACEQRQAARQPSIVPQQPARSPAALPSCLPAAPGAAGALRRCGEAGPDRAGLRAVPGPTAEPGTALPAACADRGAWVTWKVLPLSESGDSAGGGVFCPISQRGGKPAGFPVRDPSRFAARNQASGILHWGILSVSVYLVRFSCNKTMF